MSEVIGIMGAMPEEIEGVVRLMANKREVIIGCRTYSCGTIGKTEVVVVFSHWGKVAAASTAVTLIVHFGVKEIIFTGVAGGLSEELAIGDVVVAKRLFQHDMDASPILRPLELPLLGVSYVESSVDLQQRSVMAVSKLVEQKKLHALFDDHELEQFRIQSPKCFIGDVVSGDQFVSNPEQRSRILKAIPNALCAEMEGAAVAQVCFEFKLPFIVIRTISDGANENSHVDFSAFVKKIASAYSVEIIKNILK